MSIKAFIENRDLTQKELAQALGISKASMSRKISGESPVNVRDLRKIYEAFSPLSEDEMQELLSK